MNALKVTAAVALLLSMEIQPLCAQTNRWPGPPPSFRGPGQQPLRPRAAPAWNNKRRIDFRLSTFDLATNFVVAKVVTGEEVPSKIALVVKRVGLSATGAPAAYPAPPHGTNLSPSQAMEFARARIAAMQSQFEEEKVDWEKATWIPFTTTLPIDLGPGEGKRLVSIAGRWQDGNGTYEVGSGTHVKVRLRPPLVVITNPPEAVTSQPMIQLQGYTDEPVQRIRYDLFNASKTVTDAEGFVTDQYFDSASSDYTSNYFNCFDIDLAPGTNTIVLRCQDWAGNTATNTLTYTFTTEGDKTPPSLALDRPINGHWLSGETFTARGRTDDPTARLTALVVADGRTNLVEGLVERNGYFWVEHIPLRAGANLLTLTATDAAGNSSQTNLVVYRSNELLTLDPIPPDRLWQGDVTVSGRVSPPNQPVWVNGVQARVKGDGTWVAEHVPVLSPNGGTAVFEATTQLAPAATTNQPPPLASPQHLISVNTGLGTNALTLNPRQPSCGVFNLHLTGAAGRSFVLLTSTNLASWIPLLTNLGAQDTFEFTDTNTAGEPCRFFRLVPIP